jgi:hypothetical protein
MIPSIDRNDLILLLATALRLTLNRLDMFIRLSPVPSLHREGRNYFGDSFLFVIHILYYYSFSSFISLLVYLLPSLHREGQGVGLP